MTSPKRATTRKPSALATRRRALALIEQLGGDAIDNSGPGDVNINVYSPTGYIWFATDCHSLTCRFYTDPAAGWAALEADLVKGLVPCDTKDCEVCEEGRAHD